MHFSVTQHYLKAALERGAAVAPKKSAVAILSHVRLIADADGRVAVATTDLDRFAEAHCEANVTVPGAVTVPAPAFTTLIGKHPKDGLIELVAINGALLVSCGRSKVKLPTLPADEFPKWADEEPVAEFVLPGATFEKAANRVRFAASAEDIRYYLQGIFFDVDTAADSLSFVATDGNRLAVSTIPLPEGAENCPRAIVPCEAIDTALRIFKGAGEVILAFTDKAVSLTADGLRFSSKLIDGDFPNYRRVIPERGQPALTVKRADFVDCLDRASVTTGELALGAVIATPDGSTLRLNSRNSSGAEAHEEMNAEVDPAFQRFGFNPRYAAQFLTTLAVDELTIEQTDPRGPHLIHSAQAPDFTGVLMPVSV